jgi:hypothetical protein
MTLVMWGHVTYGSNEGHLNGWRRNVFVLNVEIYVYRWHAYIEVEVYALSMLLRTYESRDDVNDQQPSIKSRATQTSTF